MSLNVDPASTVPLPRSALLERGELWDVTPAAQRSGYRAPTALTRRARLAVEQVPGRAQVRGETAELRLALVLHACFTPLGEALDEMSAPPVEAVTEPFNFEHGIHDSARFRAVVDYADDGAPAVTIDILED